MYRRIVVNLELGDIALRGLVGLTPASATIDFDGSRPGFDRDTERAFFGASLEYRGFARHRPYVSFLVQRDENDRDFAVIGTDIGGFPTRFEYDSEYVAIGSKGTILSQVRYRAEFVYETGRGESSPFDAATGLPVTQRREDVEAWAALGELTYLFNDERESRVDLGFAIASGDRDRIDSANTFGGNAAGTTDRAFNGLGYVNTGLALAPDISNLLSIRLGYSTSPLRTGGHGRWLRAGVAGFLFTKVNQSAPLNVGTVDKTFVGGEVDLMLDWRITSDVSLGLRYGVFIPGEAIPDDEDDVRHFVYAGVTYAF